MVELRKKWWGTTPRRQRAAHGKVQGLTTAVREIPRGNLSTDYTTQPVIVGIRG